MATPIYKSSSRKNSGYAVSWRASRFINTIYNSNIIFKIPNSSSHTKILDLSLLLLLSLLQRHSLIPVV